MQVSEQWLRSWLELDWDAQRLSHALTMAGLEVDAWTPLAGGFEGVVVARVLDVQPHPNADRLRVVQVDVGDGQTRQIVCGAANVREGLLVPLALPGGRVGEMVLRESKLRGVLSQGMLCGADELGLAEQREGLMELPASAEPGVSLTTWLRLDDAILELGITPNRGDCLSVRGLAREVSVLAQCPLREPVIPRNSFNQDLPALVVDVQTPACGRYLARRMTGLRADAVTPDWMRRCLERSGLRCVHPVVDITNYVMLELGQPMHAFDAATLQGGIVVRQARAGEVLKALGGQSLFLKADHTVVADQRSVLALAGIVGGADSAVSATSTEIVLEAAYFDAVALAGKARELGLHTDSSHRFERGVDPELPALAIERATQWVLEICGGEAGPVMQAEYKEGLPVYPRIFLRAQRLQQVLGVNVEAASIVGILTALGMKVDPQSDGCWVQVPSWRFDVREEIDLIEEVGRIYGYDRLPTRLPTAHLGLGRQSESRVRADRLLQCLMDAGYQEAITYSFIDRTLQHMLDPECEPLALANPMTADMAVMRTSLWPGLVKAVQFNQHRQQLRVRLFEQGLRFVPGEGGLQQQRMLAGVIAGSRDAEAWNRSETPVDFYDIKGNVEQLLALGSGFDTVRFEAVRHPALHPGQSAAVYRQGVCLGQVGRLHPDIELALQLQGPVFVFELDWEALSQAVMPVTRMLSRFPEVRRDLAVVVADQVPAAELLSVVRAAAGPALSTLGIFDVYAGTGVAPGFKSLALSLVWQAGDRTLQDEEVQGYVDIVLEQMKTEFAAVLRD